jgi:hypothetical protein
LGKFSHPELELAAPSGTLINKAPCPCRRRVSFAYLSLMYWIEAPGYTKPSRASNPTSRKTAIGKAHFSAALAT